ncbi:MAG TPA: SRPBCC family protein [Gemmatimonadales bacterium]|jgi:hypothetical protein|nr:SRPBCC family protein [Gemmatimonadales bacterium]
MKWVVIVVGGLVGLIALMALIGALLPRDHRATSTIMLRQPADSVWKVVRDLGGAAAWWPEVKASTRLPDRDGRETWRQKMGDFDAALIVVEARAPARMVTRIDGGEGAAFGGTWTYELTSVDGGTLVRVTEAGWISNPIFRVMARLFGYYGTLDGYLTNLGKRFGETVTPAHS